MTLPVFVSALARKSERFSSSRAAVIARDASLLPAMIARRCWYGSSPCLSPSLAPFLVRNAARAPHCARRRRSRCVQEKLPFQIESEAGGAHGPAAIPRGKHAEREIDK